MVSIRIPGLFLWLGLLPGFTSIYAQWTLQGRVVDAESGEGLAYVNILYSLDPYLGTTSDQEGRFTIRELQQERCHLRFSMIGFQTLELDSVTSSPEPMEIRMIPENYLAREVVVSAARRSQSLHLAPASVGLVTRQQLSGYGTRTFDEAFNDMNGVVAIRSSGSNTQSLSIRGASETAGGGIGNRVLLLLDGRPAITPESGGALWNLVPLGAIERIEVIKGAYSSLFGSSAMGGIVNVITRSPDTVAATEIHSHAGVYEKAPAYTQYSRIGYFYGVDATHSGRAGKLGYLLNGSAKTNTGHRDQAAFSLYNGYAKFRYDFSPNRLLTFSAMYNDMFNETPATWLSITRPYNVADYRLDDSQHRREWNVDLNYQAFAHSRVKYTTRFYYYSALSDFVFDSDPANDSTNVNIGRQYVAASGVIANRAGLSAQADLSLGDDHYLIGGVEFFTDYVNGQPDTVLYGIHKAWNAGIYLQDQVNIGPRLILTGGFRYDYYRIAGTFMEANINPKIAAVYHLDERISFRILAARAYRNPSIAERFTKFEQGGGLSFLPSPDLRAEKLTLSLEAGAKFSLGAKMHWDVALYYNKYKDLISYQQVQSPTGGFLFEVINLNQAVMQGVEVGLDYAPCRWARLSAGYTFLDARDVSPEALNDVLAYKSRHTTYVALRLTHKKATLQVDTRSRSRIEEVFIYPGSEPGGYLLLNARLDYAFTPRFGTSFRIENLGYREYEEIERYRMQGRNYTLGFSWSL